MFNEWINEPKVPRSSGRHHVNPTCKTAKDSCPGPSCFCATEHISIKWLQDPIGYRWLTYSAMYLPRNAHKKYLMNSWDENDKIDNLFLLICSGVHAINFISMLTSKRPKWEVTRVILRYIYNSCIWHFLKKSINPGNFREE